MRESRLAARLLRFETSVTPTAKKAVPERSLRAGKSPREKPQQVADELRRLIILGELDEGDSLGHEPDLVERFGVSRPSLREALRILEAEGLISVIRGVQGGVVVHRPDKRLTARTAALVLQARNVPLADVFEARTIIEPAAVRLVAAGRNRRSCAKRLRALIAEEEEAIEDPEAFGQANARFHEELVEMAGNQTLTIVAEMLNEVVERAVTLVSQEDSSSGSVTTRRRGVRSQERLAALVELGDADGAEEHWRTHMGIVGRVMLGQKAKTVIDLLDHL
jgi:DNA-binding FadR family transcriptional regulator